MGRPPLPLGTGGKVLFGTLRNGRVKARVTFARRLSRSADPGGPAVAGIDAMTSGQSAG